MAIDFSQVKTITIPEGSVNKITDSNGNTLWQSASWHTIWEGNETGGNPIYLNELSGQVTLRVTWSCTASGGGSDYKTTYFNNNGWTNTTNTKPDNPFQFDLNADSNRSYIIGVKRYNNSNSDGGSAYLSWYYRNSGSYFYITTGYTQGASVRVSMTITKIEQYY